MILREIKHMIFFDGINSNINVTSKNEYWFGSAESEKYLRANILFSNENEDEVEISLFEQSQHVIHKNLSDWNAPKKGFYKDDLISLSNYFKFELREDKKGNTEAFSSSHSLEMIMKKQKNNFYFFVFSISGGRAPEGIYIYGLYEVLVDNEFIKRYFQ